MLRKMRQKECEKCQFVTEHREGSNDHPGVGFRETELENLIARMEREVGHWDALQGTWNSDALFGFCQEHGIF